MFEQEVRNYKYNLCYSLSTIFDLVEDLQLLAEAAKTRFPKNQLVSFGVEILWATHDFQDGIKA